MRCTLLFLTALILPGLRPADARAQFSWTQPEWQLSPFVTFTPTDANASITLGQTTADAFTANIHTFAYNPVGPGGGMASASLSISRSFQIDSPTNVIVPLRLTLDGSLYSGFPGASSNFSIEIGIVSYGLLFQTGSGIGALDYDQTKFPSLPSGTYNVSGLLSTSCSATSGGPQAGADVLMTFGLASTPIPEPAALPLLALAALGLHRARRTSSF